MNLMCIVYYINVYPVLLHDKYGTMIYQSRDIHFTVKILIFFHEAQNFLICDYQFSFSYSNLSHIS